MRIIKTPLIEERIIKAEIQCNPNRPFAECFPHRDANGEVLCYNKQHHCIFVVTLCKLRSKRKVDTSFARFDESDDDDGNY